MVSCEVGAIYPSSHDMDQVRRMGLAVSLFSLPSISIFTFFRILVVIPRPLNVPKRLDENNDRRGVGSCGLSLISVPAFIYMTMTI